LPTRDAVAEASAARAKAESNFKKEERAKEGAKAMLEYQANGREIRENMAKLKALRLAKEAADRTNETAAPATAAAAKEPARKKLKR
jgi:hypothetical protein